MKDGRDREGQDVDKDTGEQERKAMAEEAPGDMRQNRPDAGRCRDRACTAGPGYRGKTPDAMRVISGFRQGDSALPLE